MTPTPRARRLLHTKAAAAALVAVAGCGISTTDAVRAGGPATGVQQQPGHTQTVQLYFASAYGIRQASRPATGPTTPQQALNLLLEGPTDSERARGLANHIPQMPHRPSAFAGPGTVDLFLPLSVAAGELDNIVLSQMVCTLVHAKNLDDTPPDRIVVRVHETSAGRPAEDDAGFPVRCGARSLSEPGGTPPGGLPGTEVN
ncbi:hypothetical protein ACFYYB_27235 [Streptomyces sp. NPDC002886]|uniref:hypothetical protein n=1 Tax=Streptomyces sp. NPDC002886 TaxID=3364667 RepID=UPI003688A2DA